MILAIDIGTTFLKVAVVNYTGELLFFEKQAVSVDYVDSKKQVDPTSWKDVLQSISSGIDIKLLGKVEAVVVSGNGPTLVPVGSNGKPTSDALLWLDTQSSSLFNELLEKTGEPIPPNFFLGKAYWFMKEREDLYLKSDKFLSCPEYICYLLTDELFTLLPHPGFLKFYWTNEQIEKLGLDPLKFPPYINYNEIYGKLNNNSIINGVNIGTPVICGGPDFIMSLLGTGSIDYGIICDRTGTSEGINYCSNQLINIPGLRTLPHIADNLFTISGLIPESGNYILNGEEHKLLIEYKAIIDKMILSGFDIKEIRLIGGHANIEALNIEKSKLYDIPLKIYSEGSDLIGNAVLGSIVIKKYSSFKEACQNMIREKICYNI
ncbi:MAG: hypothetical protein JXR64_03480 [Spirochaetales bacterium]|nr:hypothetical protein [Spirochaetales bacterium]